MPQLTLRGKIGSLEPGLGIRDILVRIRIPGSVPMNTVMGPDPAPDPTPFFIDFKDAKKISFHIFFL